MYNFNIQSSIPAITDIYGKDFITDEHLIEIKYHSYEMMGIIMEWISDDNTIRMKQIALLQYYHTPEYLKDAYSKYAFI